MKKVQEGGRLTYRETDQHQHTDTWKRTHAYTEKDRHTEESYGLGHTQRKTDTETPRQTDKRMEE